MHYPKNVAFRGLRAATACLAVAAAFGLAATPVLAESPDTTFQYAQGLFERKFYSLAVDKYLSYIQAAPDGPHAAEAEFMVGESYYLLKDWAKAAAAYDRYLGGQVAGPERAVAEDHLGDSEFNLDHFAEAANAFRKALAASPNPGTGASAGYWLSQSLIAQKDYRGAAKAASAMVEKYPESPLVPQALLVKGIGLAESDQPTAAAAVYRDIIARFGHSDAAPEAVFRLGDALYASQDYRGAEVEYQRVLSDYPQSSFVIDATDALAWARLKQKNYAGAAGLFEKVAAAGKGDRTGQEAALQAALCYLKLGQVAKGRGALRSLAGQQGEFSADAQYLLARSFLEEKSYAEAAAGFKSFIQDHPTDSRAPFAYAGLGSAAAALNQYDTAADAYTHASAGVTDRKLKLDVLTGLLWADRKLGKQEDAARTQALIRKEFPESKLASDSQLGDADRAFDNKQYAQALTGYQEYLKDQAHGPEAERAIYRSEVCRIKLDRLADARKSLTLLTTTAPASSYIPDALLALADASFEAKDYPAAVPLYSQILGSYGGSAAAPWALYGRASAHVLTGDLDGAYGDFARLAAEHPRDANAPEAAFRLGWIREKQKRASEAAADYQKAAADFPTGSFTAEAEFRRGVILASEKKYDEADAAWEDVAQRFARSPFAPQAVAAEAWSAVDQKKTDRAEALFGTLLSEYPAGAQSADAMAELAALKLERGDLDAAASLFAKFQASYPRDPQLDRIAYGAALVQYKKGNFAAAADQFSRIPIAFPQSDLRPEAAFWSAESFLKAQKPEQALPLYQEFLQRWPTSPHAAAADLGAGLSEQKLQHWSEAIPYYKKAFDLDSAHFGARASCYTGECQLALHQPAAALDSLLKVVVLFPDDLETVDEAQFAVGQAYEEQKDVAHARDAYTRLAASTTGSAYAEKARQRLAALKTAG